MLDKIADAGSATALILSIDSPGGTTAGSEALYDAIRKVSEKKPVVAQIGTVAASGGYAAAIATDHIVARRTSITGSTGVLLHWADVSKPATYTPRTPPTPACAHHLPVPPA